METGPQQSRGIVSDCTHYKRYRVTSSLPGNQVIQLLQNHVLGQVSVKFILTQHRSSLWENWLRFDGQRLTHPMYEWR